MSLHPCIFYLKMIAAVSMLPDGLLSPAAHCGQNPPGASWEPASWDLVFPWVAHTVGFPASPVVLCLCHDCAWVLVLVDALIHSASLALHIRR